MDSPIQPTMSVNIGGTERPLRFEHRDFAEAESRLGKPLIGPASIEMWNSGASAHHTGLLLFTGLLHVIPGLTLDQARAFITFENMVEIGVAVTAAFQAALPRRDDGAQAEVEPEAIPLVVSNSGSCSGPSDCSTSDSPIEPSGA